MERVTSHTSAPQCCNISSEIEAAIKNKLVSLHVHGLNTYSISRTDFTIGSDNIPIKLLEFR